MRAGAGWTTLVCVAALVGLAGCGIDKAGEHARQLDAIGDVEIATTFCTSGEADRASHACALYDESHRGQALVAYRIPVGSDAPDGFADDRGVLSFSRSDSYTAYMRDTFPEDGMTWVGYVSQPQTVAGGTQAAFTVAPRFGLPDAGGPQAEPFRYEVEGGFRELPDLGDDGSAPIDCSTGPPTVCLQPGLPERPDSELPVRDLALEPGGGEVTVAPGEHASVPFSARLAGAGGARFELSASSDLGGARVDVGEGAIEPAADSRAPVSVDVAVPAGAREGLYEVTLTASVAGEPGVIVFRAGAGGAEPRTEQRAATMRLRVTGAPEAAQPASAPPAAAPPPHAPPGPLAAAQPPARPRARLALSLRAVPSRTYSGTYASYLLVASNVSQQTARRARVCQSLPGRVQFVRATRRVRFHGRRVCFRRRRRLRAGHSLVALVRVHVDTDARAGMARSSARAAASNADPARARARIRILHRAAAPRPAPVTG